MSSPKGTKTVDFDSAPTNIERQEDNALAINADRDSNSSLDNDDDSPMSKIRKLRQRREQRELEKAGSRSLPIQYVQENLEGRIARDTAYSDLLMYIPFVGLFFVFFLAGRDVEKNHHGAAANRLLYLEEPYPDYKETLAQLKAQEPTNSPVLPMDRIYYETDTVEQYHRWLRGIMIPGTWDCDQPGYSRSTLLKRGQLQYIGAMRWRSLIVRNDSCDFNTNYGISIGESTGVSNTTSAKDALKIACFSRYWLTGIDKSTRKCDKVNPAKASERLWRFTEALEDGNGFFTTGSLNLYQAGGYVAELPFNATCNSLREFQNIISETTDELGEARDAVDACNVVQTKSTRFVIHEWFQYAANTDTFMVNKLFFEVHSGGAWIPNHQIRMFPVWTIRRLWMSIFDIFFFIFVLYFFYRLMYDWITFYRMHKKVLAFMFDIWNILEIANIATLFAVFILRWIWWNKSQVSKISFPFEQEYPKDLDALVLLFSSQIYANSVNVVITVLKVLKYFRLNNRLNVLTRTFAVAQQDIVGILILFVFVVTGYAICGTVLYGGHLFAYKNVNSSFSALMFLLLGQFDYVSMRALQPQMTALFFFSYVILSNFLLLNFIIAILGEGFSTVSTQTALEPLDEAIVRQIYHIKEMLTFRNLKKSIELRRKGKSRGNLLKEMFKYIKEHIELIEERSPELLDSDLPMYRSDLKHWLPEQLYYDLGDHFLDVLWADMVHDYGIDTKSDQYQMHRDIEDAMIDTMKNVFHIEDVVRPIASLDRSVAKIEELVDKVVQGTGTNIRQSVAFSSPGSGKNSLRGSMAIPEDEDDEM